MNKSKVQKNEYTFWRLIFTEFKFSFTPVKIIGMLIGGLLLPFLVYFLMVIINGVASTLMLTFLTSQAACWFIFSRVTGTVQDKATVDKNKALFVYYSKNKATFAKMLVEAIMFCIGFLTLFLIGLICAESNSSSHINEGKYITSAFEILPGYLSLHLVAYTLAKWVVSFIPKKGLSYVVALFSSLIVLAPIFILNQIPATTVHYMAINQGGLNKNNFINTGWFGRHQLATSFIPYMNLGLINGVGVEDTVILSPKSAHPTPPMHIKLLEEQWYVIMPIIYNFIALGASWTFQASAQKRYLSQ